MLLVHDRVSIMQMFQLRVAVCVITRHVCQFHNLYENVFLSTFPRPQVTWRFCKL